MEDEKIVDLFWARIESAVSETASKYGKYCYAIAYNILNDSSDADESVNDTYLDAWNCMPPHRPSILSTFLGKITRRISIDKWRKYHAKKRGEGEVPLVLDELQECLSDNNSVEQEVELKLLANVINSFVKELPEMEQKVFLCRYWYMDSIDAICTQFGFSKGKVKSMLFRTREKLRDVLVKEEF